MKITPLATLWMFVRNLTSLVDRHLLLECWKVSVDGYAAEVVDEGEVFWYISCCPVTEEAIQNTLVSSCNREGGKISVFLQSFLQSKYYNTFTLDVHIVSMFFSSDFFFLNSIYARQQYKAALHHTKAHLIYLIKILMVKSQLVKY